MLVNYSFTVDVANPKPCIIHAVQGDSMRSVTLILQKDGAAYDPESDLSSIGASGGSIYGAVLCNKADGTKCAYTKASWQASGAKAVTKESTGKYKAILDDQCFAAAGPATIFIRLYVRKSGVDTGQILHTFSIKADVEKNHAANIQSKDYFNLPSQAELAATVARAVLYDVQTGFSDNPDKKNARNNILALRRGIMAPDWKNTNTYSFGDYVLYNDNMYRYNSNTPSNGADTNGNFKSSLWVSATFASTLPSAVRVSVDQTFTTAQKTRARNNIEAARKGYIATDYNPSATYQVGDWAMFTINNKDVIKECITAIPAPGEAYNPAHWTSANMSVGSTIANILRQLQNLTPGDEGDEGSGELVLENNLVYCDYDIPSATDPATDVTISASAFYPLPTNTGDIVFGRNGKLAIVTELTYDQNDPAVLVSGTVRGILDRFSGRDDLTAAYAEQQTYNSIINFLANQGTGKYVVTSGSGATARIYYADNDLVDNIIVSKISAYSVTSVTEYIYIGGTRVFSASYVSSGNGISFVDTHVFGRDPQSDSEFVTLHYLNNNRKPQVFTYAFWLENFQELPTTYGEVGGLAFADENSFKNCICPSLDPMVGDVLLELSQGYAAEILSMGWNEDYNDWTVVVRGLGNIRDVQRQPQIFVYTPSDEEAQLPASGSVTLETNSPLRNYLNPSISPMYGDILYDRYTCNIARISGTIDAEVGDYYATNVTGIGTLLDPRIPAAPSADGTYTLTATVASGEVTYSWT